MTPKSSVQTLSDEQRAEMERENRLMAAFPWAASLSPSERAQFAKELANHPRDLQNAQLEALILTWKSMAQGSRAVRRTTRRAA